MDKARLREIPLFDGLSEDDLNTIATFAEETSVGEGEVLVREGDFSAELIAIEEGTAEVRHGDDVVANLGPGDYFGEVGVLGKELRSADVVATSGMRLLTLSNFAVNRMRKMPGVLERIEETIASRSAGR
jgi:CRP/FNR family cyclic AMP-dependent transcriptional regulator